MTGFTDMDHVMMKNGTSYVGKLTTRKLRVNLDGIDGEIEVKTSNVIRVEFHNDYGMPLDEIVLRSGSKLRGWIMDKTVTFRSDDLGKLKLKADVILAIQLLSNL